MPELIFVIGIPGAGKSTYIKNKYQSNILLKRTTYVLSSDEMRKELYGDVNDQTHNEELFTIMKQRAVDFLQDNATVIIDATNLTRRARKDIIDYVENALSYFYEYGLIKFVVVATPYYKCLENNRKRERQVPEEKIRKMYHSFEFPILTEEVHKIEIVYPFAIDKDYYGVEHPYEGLLTFPHDTPYHKDTIGEHLQKSYEIMKTISNDKVMLKAAELHDIGKPFCKKFTEDGSRARYLFHENVGSYEAMFFAKMANFTIEETITLCSLIEFHMRIHDCRDNEKATKKLVNLIGSKLYYKLLMLNIADREAR